MTGERARQDGVGAGVILRDAGGACYVIPAAVLRRYRVPDEVAGMLAAFLAGDDVRGAGVWPAGETATAEARRAANTGLRALARMLDTVERSRTGHLSVTAATWLQR